MQNLHKEAHPIELALMAALVLAEALMVLLVSAVALVVALLALLLTLVQAPPATAPAPAPARPAQPLQHPLSLLAESLMALPQRELMAMAGTRRRLPKRLLIEQKLATA